VASSHGFLSVEAVATARELQLAHPRHWPETSCAWPKRSTAACCVEAVLWAARLPVFHGARAGADHRRSSCFLLRV